MRWETGRATIDQMVASGELDKVTPSRSHADFLLDQARAHLQSAIVLKDLDPAGAYQLTYDAARKALVAVLENQGLRPTAAGGHVAVIEAVRAQLDPPMGASLRPFNRMRRTRHNSEYPSPDTPAVTSDDVDDALPQSEAIVDLAKTVLDKMDPF